MSLAHDYPVSVVCAVLDLPRSSFYYKAGASADEPGLRQALLRLAHQWPTYG